jgi:hypothetical protein
MTVDSLNQTRYFEWTSRVRQQPPCYLAHQNLGGMNRRRYWASRHIDSSEENAGIASHAEGPDWVSRGTSIGRFGS